MTLAYAYEKYGDAMARLNSGRGTLQARLKDAAIDNLIHVHAEDLPEGLAKEHQLLIDHLADIPAEGTEGSIDATSTRMDDYTANALAADVTRIFGEIEKLYNQARPAQ